MTQRFLLHVLVPLTAIALAGHVRAQVPQLINYQGRVAIASTAFNGTGQFKFALVNNGATTSYWSNDGTSTAGSEPTSAVALTVTNGLYSVLLGDTGMTVIPATVFANPDVRLRVWFNDGTNGSQLLTPDQRIAAVGYALMSASAQTVPDGAITSAKLAAGAVTATNIASGTITSNQLASGAAAANLAAGGQAAVPSGGMVFSNNSNDSNLTGAGYVKVGVVDLGIAWERRASGAPLTTRSRQTAVWTGTEMIVWGGYNSGLGYFATGGRYNPASNAWTAVSALNAPGGRGYHTAVWTGSEMIVWGGLSGSSDLNDGGRYNPGTNTWTAVTTTNAPAARGNHTAVWTGTEMIVWGGYANFTLTYWNNGGRYNPSNNSWSAVSTTGAPAARNSHTAVWTGSVMVIWGGTGGPTYNDGGRYNPGTDSWAATTTTGAPTARWGHTAVWTGSEMIVWGGLGGGYYNDGARYNPSTDSWAAVSTVSAPFKRIWHTAVWTGTEMIVWGGYYYSGGDIALNDGGRYNLSGNTWTALSTTDAPGARYNHTAVWTGTEMIVWGGTDGTGFFNDTWSYAPTRPTYLYQRP